jgi:hypothetical protein
VATDSGVVLRLRGDVRAGDHGRLKSILQNGAVVGLEIRSGGGSFEDGFDIARVVRDKGLVVYAPKECDSACALIFLAAKERYIGRRCRIGVHSVSNDRGKEDGDSIRTTVQMSRLLVGLGVARSQEASSVCNTGVDVETDRAGQRSCTTSAAHVSGEP